MTMPKLKPCPFCGGEPKLKSDFRGSYVMCNDCGTIGGFVDISTKYSSDEKSIEAWNRRADNDV